MRSPVRCVLLLVYMLESIMSINSVITRPGGFRARDYDDSIE